jgi:hypothetical protein
MASTSTSLPERVRAILSMRHAGPRQTALIECLDDAAAGDMEAIADLFHERARRSMDEEAGIILEHWVLLDGPAAMAWMAKHDLDVLARPMLIAWAGSDPQAAMAWLQKRESHHDSRGQSIGRRSSERTVIMSLEEAALRGWAQRDPVAATTFRLDPANAALFDEGILKSPREHGAHLHLLMRAVYDSAGTAGLNKWLPQLASLPKAPPDLASKAFALACEEVSPPGRGTKDSTLEFYLANAGKPWCPPDTLRDILWKAHGSDTQLLLQVSNRLGPDSASGLPWFTAESAAARQQLEDSSNDSSVKPGGKEP